VTKQSPETRLETEVSRRLYRQVDISGRLARTHQFVILSQLLCPSSPFQVKLAASIPHSRAVAQHPRTEPVASDRHRDTRPAKWPFAMPVAIVKVRKRWCFVFLDSGLANLPLEFRISFACLGLEVSLSALSHLGTATPAIRVPFEPHYLVDKAT